MARLRRGVDRDLGLQLLAAAACGIAGCAVLATAWASAPLAPTYSAHDAMLAFLLGYLLLHGGLAVLLALLQAARVRHGHVGLQAPYEPGVVAILWLFVAGATAVAWVAFVLLPASLSGPG